MPSHQRKYTFSLLVIIYLITTIGIPVYSHYCGGALESVSYLVTEDNCCDDEEPVDNDCCKDEITNIHLTPEFTVKKIATENTITPPVVTLPFDLFHTCSSVTNTSPIVSNSKRSCLYAQRNVLHTTILRL